MRDCKQADCLCLYGSLLVTSSQVCSKKSFIPHYSSGLLELQTRGSSWGHPGWCFHVRRGCAPLLLQTSSCRFYTDMCWLEQTHAEALWWKFQRWTESWSSGRVFEMTLFYEAVNWDVRLSSGWRGHCSTYWKRGCWSPSEISKSILLSVQCKRCTVLQW